MMINELENEIVVIARYWFNDHKIKDSSTDIDGCLNIVIKRGFDTYQEALDFIDDNNLMNCEVFHWSGWCNRGSVDNKEVDTND